MEPQGYHKSQRFFPSTVFSEQLNEGLVRKELQRQLPDLNPAEERRLTQKICGYPSFRKVFSLLAIVDKSSDIRYFIEQEVSDDRLPLSKIRFPGCNLFTLGIPTDTDGNSVPISCFGKWNPATIRMFEEWQWSTLAPTFQCGETKDVKHLSLPDDVPLPFTADSQHDRDSNSMQGGYSTVSKITIHPAHHCFHGLEVISHLFPQSSLCFFMLGSINSSCCSLMGLQQRKFIRINLQVVLGHIWQHVRRQASHFHNKSGAIRSREGNASDVQWKYQPPFDISFGDV